MDLIGLWLCGFLKTSYILELFGTVLLIFGLTMGSRKVLKPRDLK